MSSSNSPCAACKCLRRKCTQECVFAPYFPPDNPQKFTNVHKVFGASNISKLLKELSPGQREDAVNSLAFEAEYRINNPVYGCVGLISILQHRLKQVQHDLENAKKELATYIGPSAMLPMLNPQALIQQHLNNYGSSAYQVMPYNVQAMMGLPTGVPHAGQLMQQQQQHQHQHQHQQHQYMDAQQFAAVAAAANAREHEILRAYSNEQQHHQHQHQHQPHDLARFNGGFDDAAGPVTATGFNQMPAAAVATMQPSLALGNSYDQTLPYNHIQQHTNMQEFPNSQSHHPHQIQLQSQELLLQQQQSVTPHNHHQQTQQQLAQQQASHSQQHLPRPKSEDGRSVGPSC